MAILWAENFDYFGGDTNKLLNGLWASFTTIGGTSYDFELVTTSPRSGTHCLEMNGAGTAQSESFARRVFPSALTTFGFAEVFYSVNLPAANNTVILAQFRDAANALQLTVYLQSTGAIAVWRASGTSPRGTLLGTSTVLATANAWSHIETRVVMSDTVGAVTIRLNETTILDLTNIDTVATALVECSQVAVGYHVPSPEAATLPTVRWDDMILWDTSSSYNNDFLGDHHIFTVFPNQDTAEADWIESAGSVGYSLIDDATPDDATYIEATAVNDVSVFELGDLSAEVSSIAAVITMPRMLKTAGGTSKVQVSMLAAGSPTAAADGADRAITEAATYWPDVFQEDPGTAAPWSRDSFNAAQIRVTRTA